MVHCVGAKNPTFTLYKLTLGRETCVILAHLWDKGGGGV